MILSNAEIIKALREGVFRIEGLDLATLEPSEKPFNTSAIDLRLGNEIIITECDIPVQLDLRKSNIAKFWAANSKTEILKDDRPYVLKRNTFVLANTLEKVTFPLVADGQCYSARVEGKSSFARCGVLIHFTAPTIHSGWSGHITLEMMNMGPAEFLLFPKMYVCQLIIEEVRGCPIAADSQFQGQINPVGKAKA